MNGNLITLEDIRVRLGNRDILTGVSGGLTRGKITSLIGLNGSGKSTLLRALVKEIPYEGRFRFHCGHSHHEMDPTHVGYVPQRLRLEGGLPITVRDFLGLPLQDRPVFLGFVPGLEKRLQTMLSRVGLPVDMLNRPVDRLSGGELQRVLLALALEPSPELLLLDEPAAGIDFHDQERFYQLLSDLNQATGVTILLVSHDLGLVKRHASQVWCLHQGKIALSGNPAEVLEIDRLKSLYGQAAGLGSYVGNGIGLEN
ncbi:MAG: metal ABC transporter ATP-binding protein [Gemmataceae bacterium]|nr:metal ABC transporter ATP-binding protein [Gemmataceae bacterium]